MSVNSKTITTTYVDNTVKRHVKAILLLPVLLLVQDDSTTAIRRMSIEKKEEKNETDCPFTYITNSMTTTINSNVVEGRPERVEMTSR